MIAARLQHLADAGQQDLLARLRRGIEKESLRVTPNGRLSTAPHPEALGAALTHPQITTDFSESQLELITGVHEDIDSLLAELAFVHRAVYQYMDRQERLWCTSMPCMLGSDDAIPVGRYGRSNVGRSKSIYRRGLANRYGALMQTISGIHYNFSVPDALWPALFPDDPRAPMSVQTDGYFALIRNFRRTSWLLLYLFGASPALCKTFVAGRQHHLQSLGKGTLYTEHATSLRMGRLGYQSDAQADLHVSYNSVDEYAATLYDALTRPYPPYTALGVRSPDGDYAQLNDYLLQIENEFYGTIRPKRRIEPGERPLHALDQRGVEYVEVRCVDLNPFQPFGIDAEQIRFLDTFLLYCLLADSPPDSVAEDLAIRRNQLTIVERGREPELVLERHGGDTTRDAWATEILDACEPLAAALDAAVGGDGHARSLAAQRAKVTDSAHTPSARILDELVRADMPFFQYALEASGQHAIALREAPLTADEAADFEASVAASHRRQAEIEAADVLSFDDYLADFLRPERLLTAATRTRLGR